MLCSTIYETKVLKVFDRRPMLHPPSNVHYTTHINGRKGRKRQVWEQFFTSNLSEKHCFKVSRLWRDEEIQRTEKHQMVRKVLRPTRIPWVSFFLTSTKNCLLFHTFLDVYKFSTLSSGIVVRYNISLYPSRIYIKYPIARYTKLCSLPECLSPYQTDKARSSIIEHLINFRILILKPSSCLISRPFFPCPFLVWSINQRNPSPGKDITLPCNTRLRLPLHSQFFD